MVCIVDDISHRNDDDTLIIIYSLNFSRPHSLHFFYSYMLDNFNLMEVMIANEYILENTTSKCVLVFEQNTLSDSY